MELRPTPRHIDRSSRIVEYLVIALVPFVFVRPWFEAAGLFLMFAMPAVYAVLTVGKPEGFLLHLAYSLGIPVRGLLPPQLRRLDR